MCSTPFSFMSGANPGGSRIVSPPQPGGAASAKELCSSAIVPDPSSSTLTAIVRIIETFSRRGPANIDGRSLDDHDCAVVARAISICRFQCGCSYELSLRPGGWTERAKEAPGIVAVRAARHALTSPRIRTGWQPILRLFQCGSSNWASACRMIHLSVRGP